MKIPQAPNLRKIRIVVEAIRSGNGSTSEIADATGISKRHVNYLTVAAERLGLTKSHFGPLSSDGNSLLRSRANSRQERSVYCDAIASSPLVEDLGINIVAPQPPMFAHLLARIEEVDPQLGKETIQHRAGDMMSWRRQLQLDVPLPRLRGTPQLGLFEAATSQKILPPDLVRDLHRSNPWWQGLPSRPVSTFRRAFVSRIHEYLELRLASIIVVRGPRQVGKTTAQEQIIDELLKSGVKPQRILRVQFDEIPSIADVKEPILRIAEWFEQHLSGLTFNQMAKSHEAAFIFLDEVQNLDGWAAQLKFLVDHSSLQLVVTGSSALGIEMGRDSLAGRIQTIQVGVLTLSEIAAFRHGDTAPGFMRQTSDCGHTATREFWDDLVEHGRKYSRSRDRAFQSFSERGGYPLAHLNPSAPWPVVAKLLNETVIRRVIAHDLLVAERTRKREHSVLEEIFRLCCRYAGQCPTPEELSRQLGAFASSNVGPKRVKEYLGFLNRTLLVQLVNAPEIQLRKKRGAPKICLIDHALRASWFQEEVPLLPKDLQSSGLADVAGHLVESIVGTCLLNSGEIDVCHFPEREDEPEVDFVVVQGMKRVPIEVKYRKRIQSKDFAGLLSFTKNRRYNAQFGVLISQDGAELATSVPQNIVVVPLSSFLLLC